MNSAIIIGSVLIFVPVVLVASLAIGVFGFNPQRAQSIRAAEASDSELIEEVRLVHVVSPERFRRGRVDRHPMYLGLHVSTFCYAVCILLGAVPTSNLASLNPQTRFTMAACFIVGSTLSSAGAMMGARLWKWNIVAGVRDNIATSRLGDDVRLPYTFGAIGMFCMMVSLGIYTSTSFKSTLGSLGGWWTGVFAILSMIMLGVFVSRIRQYSRTLTMLINDAVANITQRGTDVAE